MRKILGFLAAVVVALSLVACDPIGSSSSDGGSDDKPSGPVAIGTPIEVDEGSWNSTVTVHTATWHAAGQGEFATTPTNGAYLVIDVEWSGEGSYNPLYLNFRAETGVESDAFSGALSGFEPALQSGELGGGMVRGLVSFDAPQDPGVIILSDPLGGHLGSWTITA